MTSYDWAACVKHRAAPLAYELCGVYREDLIELRKRYGGDPSVSAVVTSDKRYRDTLGMLRPCEDVHAMVALATADYEHRLEQQERMLEFREQRSSRHSPKSLRSCRDLPKTTKAAKQQREAVD